jgi:hypothetical protein
MRCIPPIAIGVISEAHAGNRPARRSGPTCPILPVRSLVETANLPARSCRGHSYRSYIFFDQYSALQRIKRPSSFDVLNVVNRSSYYRTKKPEYGRYLQFQPRVGSGKRVAKRDAQPVVQSTDTTDDLDRSKLSQLVPRFLDLRDTDYREPTPGRPE